MTLIDGAPSRYWLAPVTHFGTLLVVFLRRSQKRDGLLRHIGDFQMERDWPDRFGRVRLKKSLQPTPGSALCSAARFTSLRPLSLSLGSPWLVVLVFAAASYYYFVRATRPNHPLQQTESSLREPFCSWRLFVFCRLRFLGYLLLVFRDKRLSALISGLKLRAFALNPLRLSKLRPVTLRPSDRDAPGLLTHLPWQRCTHTSIMPKL
jgi:hypothetical protein